MRTGLLLSVIVVLSTQHPALGGRPEPVQYRLTPKALYHHGCLAGPCLCPVANPVPIAGTFVLTLIDQDMVSTTYALSQIDWHVAFPDKPLHLTGHGTYRITGDFTLTHQIELFLTGSDGVERRFDSGMIIGGGEFPLIDIYAPLADVICVTAAIQVIAEPAPEPVGPATVFLLVPPGTYQEGCFLWCDCIVRDPEPIKGTFLLSHLEENPLFSKYAVWDIRWTYPLGDTVHQITGAGTYELGGEVALVQQMDLQLAVDRGPAERVYSERVSGGAIFPAIEIDIGTNTGCFDRIIRLRARPAGDFDLDGDVDQVDFGAFQACISGPKVPQKDLACVMCDLDGDNDVDQNDFGVFQRCLSGPDIPMKRDCVQ